MSDRIRNLEDALQSLQPSSSPNPHPLLAPDLLDIKSALALYGETQLGASHEASTHPSEDGHPSPPIKYNSEDFNMPGPSRQAQVKDLPLIICARYTDCCYDLLQVIDKMDSEILPDIMRLSHNFPLGNASSPDPHHEIRATIRSKLPSPSHASYLWEQVRQNALWQCVLYSQDATPAQNFCHRYNPHPNETFMPNLRHHVYESPIEELCPRRLALFFMILAVGCLVDLSQPPDPPIAETYHHLARASLCEIPVMEDTTFDAMVTLVCEVFI
jgi:hypothetical protein